MTTSNLRELDDARKDWGHFYENIAGARHSRRRVIKGSTAVALLATGGLSALLGACGGDDEGGTATPPAARGTAAPTSTKTAEPSAGVTGAWDTTKTAPYKKGLADAAAKIDPGWQKFPWVYKYGVQRYNWDVKVARGGSYVNPNGAQADYNIMNFATGGHLPVTDRLFNDGMREGVDVPGTHIEPELAISQEHTPDYTSWTFKLPQNVKFHNIAPVNGRQMTAKDVVFSMETIKQSSLYKASLNAVTKVTATDDYTVKFDLKGPSLTLPTVLAWGPMAIFAKEHFENQDLFKKQPIGTGPFINKFSEFQNRVERERNPLYWKSHPLGGKYGKDPLPFVDKYTSLYFANNVAAKEAFFAGQIDWFNPGCGLDPSIVREQVQRNQELIMVSNLYWAASPNAIEFNFKNPLFQDIRVRQALSMGFDRAQIWKDGVDSVGSITATPVTLEFMGLAAPPDLASYGPSAQYNPDKAKALLKEAGLTAPLKLTAYAPPSVGAFNWQNATDAVIFAWKQNGIADVTIVARDAATFLQDRINKTFPQLALVGAGSLSGGFSFDSDIIPVFQSASPRNYGSVNDPALDKLFADWSAAITVANAQDIAKKASKLIVDNVYHLWTNAAEGIQVNQPWLQGELVCNHSCYSGYGGGNYKYLWIDENAPAGRAGKRI